MNHSEEHSLTQLAGGEVKKEKSRQKNRYDQSFSVCVFQ